jgi:hypothetical protein
MKRAVAFHEILASGVHLSYHWVSPVFGGSLRGCSFGAGAVAFLDHVLIQKLCEQLLGAQSDAEVYFIAEQLRAAIHEHVEEMRLALRAIAASGGGIEQ